MKLHLNGGTAASSDIGDNPILLLENRAGSAGNRYGINFRMHAGQTFGMAEIGAITENAGAQESGGIYFATKQDTTGDSRPTEAMRIDDSGRVGIGDASPGSPLDVKSGEAANTANFNSTNGATNITLESDGSLIGQFEFASTGTSQIVTRTVSSLALGVNNSQKLIISGSSGFVGIGEPSPDEMLHLTSTGAVGIKLEADSNNSGQEDAYIILSTDNASIVAELAITSNAGDRITGGLANATILGATTASPVQLFTTDIARLTVAAGGNVGIGDTAPGAPLEVSAGSGKGQGSFGYGGVMIAASSASAQEYDGASSITWGPKISISNETATSTRTGAGISFVHRNGSSGVAAIVSTNAATDRADLRFITRGAGNAIAERMIINDDGKVGIGTASPSEMLHVASDARIGGTIRVGDGSAAAPSYRFTNDTNTGMFKEGTDSIGFAVAGVKVATMNDNTLTVFGAASDNAQIRMYADTGTGDNDKYQIVAEDGGGGLKFQTAASGDFVDMLHLQATGCVSIGTTGAGDVGSAEGLVIEGAASQTSVKFQVRDTDTAVDANNVIAQFAFTADADCTNGKFIEFADSGGVIGSVTSDGGGIDFNDTSDYRTKTDLKDIVDATKTIDKLKLYDFAWKNNTDNRSIGVIAHEAQEVFPMAIKGVKDAMTTMMSPGENGDLIEKEVIAPQQVSYIKFVPLLLKAVQELSEKNEALEKRIKELEN